MNTVIALRLWFASVPRLKSMAALLLLGLSGFIAGCGGSGVSVVGSGSGGAGTPTLASIGVTPAAPSIAQGTHQQFTATGVYSDNSKRDLTTAVTWTSSATGVATISTAAGTTGLASAVGAGPTTITATMGSVTGTTTLTVTAAALVSIAVTPANPSIAKGLTQQFIATGTYSNGTTQDLTSMVSWTSSNPSIATISATGGLATAAAPGSATIAAMMSGITGTTTLTVTAAAVVSIAVTPATPSIANGTTQQFIATGTYTDGTTQVITGMATWSSSATAVASIGAATGLAKGLTVGSTTITAALSGVSGTATLTVTPATLVSIAVTPANPIILNSVTTQHNTLQLTATGTYTDGTTQVLTTTATWTSVTTATATISNAAGSSGLATGLTLGTTAITAAAGAVTSPAVTLTVSPSEYAYVANFSDPTGTVSQYTIGSGGVLTPMSTPTVASGLEPYAIAVDPTGHYLYVGNYNQQNIGSVSQYAIGTDGSLSPITTPIPTQHGPNGLTIDPSGKYVYVANYGSGGTAGSVSQYTIGANGALSAGAIINADKGAASVAINPANSFAYVSNYLADSVSIFSIGAGGVLTPAGTTTLPANSAPSFALVDPSGKYLYVADQADNVAGVAGSIAQFTIGTGGTLTPMSTPTIAVNGHPRSLNLDPTRTYVYVADGTDSILQFAIGASGALSLTSTTVVGAGSVPNFMAVDPTGQYAYVGDRGPKATPGSSVSQYTIGTASALAPAAPPTVPAGAGPSGIATAKHY
jgi:6-phosphogluconolactonase (cycloisomerase 2 family)